MAQDTGIFHGLPIMGSLKSPGRYSPTGNDHPKQPQQHLPSCTTQAPPLAMTDDQGVLSGCRTPSIPLSPQVLDTFVARESPRSSRSPVLEPPPDPSQHGGAGAAQQELMMADQAAKPEHYSEDLGHRIKEMWPSRPGEAEVCDGDYGMLQKRASDVADGRCPSQPAHVSQGNDAYDGLASQSRGWVGDPQNMFQQPFSWNSAFPSTQASLNQSIFYPSRLDLAGEAHSNTNAASYSQGLGSLRQSVDDVRADYLNFIPTTSPVHQGYTTSAENVPNNSSLSPSLSLSFYEAPPAMCQDREDTVPLSEADNDQEYNDSTWWTDDLLGGSPSSMEAPGSKVDEPYAQLIYRAFMSRPNKSMTLQEIYQWFRENTDKAKAEGKGWQNSIRHNLSMNGAFTKRNSKTPLNGNGDGSVSLENTGVDGRKSTEWFLEPSFYTGVESTTRYRKGNSGSRSRAAGGHPARSRLGSDGLPGGGNFSHARVSAGRKGGNVAAQNRKRLAERQQHARQMDMVRGHHNNHNNNQHHPRHHLQQQQQQHMPGGGFHGIGGASMAPYPAVAAAFDGGDAPGYHFYQQHPIANVAAFGGVPTTLAPRLPTDMIGYNFFGPDDVGRDVHIKRSRTLGTDNEHSEPTTPPPRSVGDGDHHHLPFGKYHGEFLPDMGGGGGGSYNPLNSYQHHHQMEAMGGGNGQQQQQQQQAYSLADVTGIYEPPAGSHQPPVFMDSDANLSAEDALLMDLNLMK